MYFSTYCIWKKGFSSTEDLVRQPVILRNPVANHLFLWHTVVIICIDYMTCVELFILTVRGTVKTETLDGV